MEKYEEIIEQLKKVWGLKKAFDVEYDNFMDSALLSFYNFKAFNRIENDNSKTWMSFEFICNMNGVNYSLYSSNGHGVIELYFK